MRTKKRTSNAMMGELKSLAMISGGLILGSMGGKALDSMLKVDENATGFQVKKFVKPAVQLGAGVIGAMKLKDPNLKLVAAGVGASGVISTVKVVLKKDLLAGVDGLGNMGGLGQPLSVYQDLARLNPKRYNPDLPQLSAGNYTPYQESMITDGSMPNNAVEADFEII